MRQNFIGPLGLDKFSMRELSKSIDSDTSIKIWDMEKYECIRTLLGHKSWVKSIVVYEKNEATNQQLISGGFDENIKIWDMASGECLKTLHCQNNSVSVLALTKRGRLVSGSLDKKIRIWNLETYMCSNLIPEHWDTINKFTLCGKGRFLLSGSSDATIRIWSLKTKEMLNMLTDHRKLVLALAVNEKEQILSASSDNTIKTFEVLVKKSETPKDNVNFECVKTLVGFDDPIWVLLIGQQGELIVGTGGKIVVYDSY